MKKLYAQLAKPVMSMEVFLVDLSFIAVEGR